MSEQTLLAERQLLPSEPRGDMRGGRADIRKPRAQIERAAEWRRRRTDLLPGDARILHVGLKRETLRCRDRRVQTHAAERIGVVAVGGEAAVLEPFDALAELTANPQP